MNNQIVEAPETIETPVAEPTQSIESIPTIETSFDLRELFRERERLEYVVNSSLLDEVSRKRVSKRIAQITNALNEVVNVTP